MKDGVLDSLSKWLDIQVVKKDSITIPAYTGTVNFNYAKPTIKEGAE